MKSKFNYGKIDFVSYLDKYLQRDDAITSVPTMEEARENAIHGIVKDHAELKEIPAGEGAKTGDSLKISVESELPKYNKPSVSVTIGRGMYNKELEDLAVGKKKGESYSLTIKEKNVKVTVLEIKRKTYPEPTDEMVLELKAVDYKNQPITTVEDYVKFTAEGQRDSALANINYYTMEEILKDYPCDEYSEEDIEILGKLEHDMFRNIFMEQEGYDIDTLTPEQWKEKEVLGVGSWDEFVTVRHEWYQMKIQQCYVYANIQGIELEGEFDPLSRYEVLSDLMARQFTFIEEELRRRNSK